jgi:hypothetical protein
MLAKLPPLLEDIRTRQWLNKEQVDGTRTQVIGFKVIHFLCVMETIIPSINNGDSCLPGTLKKLHLTPIIKFIKETTDYLESAEKLLMKNPPIIDLNRSGCACKTQSFSNLST